MNTKGRRGEGDNAADDAAPPQTTASGRVLIHSSSHPPASERLTPLVDDSGVHHRPVGAAVAASNGAETEPVLRFRRDTPRVRPGTRTSRPPSPLPGVPTRPARPLPPDVALAVAEAAGEAQAIPDEVTRRTRRPEPPSRALSSTTLLKLAVVMLVLGLLLVAWLSS